MLKPFAVGALLASVFAAAIAPGATEVGEAAPAVALNADRLPLGANEPGCSRTAWPHYEVNCIRSRAGSGEEPHNVRQVRIVTVDRLPK